MAYLIPWDQRRRELSRRATTHVESLITRLLEAEDFGAALEASHREFTMLFALWNGLGLEYAREVDP